MPADVTSQTAGHSLIELLAALALTSVGVIGFMHAQHWRGATELELLARMQASILARDILRKMDITPDIPFAYRTDYGTPPPDGARCRHGECTHAELARSHLAHWKCHLGRWMHDKACRDMPSPPALLPAGDGRIRVSNNSVRITIRWIGANQKLQSLETLSPRIHKTDA